MTNEINALYFLFPILACITLLTYYFCKSDILEPSVIVCTMMTISSLFALWNIDRWHLSIGFYTLLVIISSLLALGFGSVWCHSVVCRKFANNVYIESNSVTSVVEISNLKICLSSLLLLLMAYISFDSMLLLSNSLGNKEGISGMIMTVRQSIEHQGLLMSSGMLVRCSIAQILAYVYIYSFAFNSIHHGFKIENSKLLIPVALYLPFIVLTTGRMHLLFLVIYTLVINAIIYQKKHGYTFAVQRKLIIVFFISGFLFFSVFLAFGSFTGKNISQNRTPFIIVSHYVGLSIPALDSFLKTEHMEDNYIGKNTLVGVYGNFRSLGFDLPKPVLCEFAKFHNIDTNVYTALRRYVEDFGYLGMLGICWLLGFFYTLFYNRIKYHESTPFAIIAYAIFCHPLFTFSQDEGFLSAFVNSYGISVIILLFLLIRVLIRIR